MCIRDRYPLLCLVRYCVTLKSQLMPLVKDTIWVTLIISVNLPSVTEKTSYLEIASQLGIWSKAYFFSPTYFVLAETLMPLNEYYTTK